MHVLEMMSTERIDPYKKSKCRGLEKKLTIMKKIECVCISHMYLHLHAFDKHVTVKYISSYTNHNLYWPGANKTPATTSNNEG